MMSLRSLFSRSASPRRKPQRRNPGTTFRPLAQRRLVVETLEGRTLLTSVVSGFALSATLPAPNGSDSGVATDAPTLIDSITSVATPTLTGSATPGTTVTVYAENDGYVNGVLNTVTDVKLGSILVPASGTWSVPAGTSLNALSGYGLDGERTLFAQDSADAAGSYVPLNVFIDTVGPRVASVQYVPGNTDVFLRTPRGPTVASNVLDITFTDAPLRTADFNFPALDSVLANDPTNYSLTGTKNGNAAIPISNVKIDNSQTVAGGVGTTQVELTFANPLPDDTYTLNILDSLQNPAGNLLDGTVTTAPTGTDTIVLPSGSGTAGSSGNFMANFTVLPVVSAFALSTTLPAATTPGVPSGSDSGIGSGAGAFAETFLDRVTNVPTPTLTGTASEAGTVNLYADTNGNGVLDATDQLLGTAAVISGGTWSITSGTSLADTSVFGTANGERTLFAQLVNSSGNIGDAASLDIFLDTTDPFVQTVELGNGTPVQGQTSPTPQTNSLIIDFTDSPTRTAEFTSFSAVNKTLATQTSNYSLVGLHGGNIPVVSAPWANTTAVDGPGQSEVTLNFAGNLPDDTYTLTVSGGLENDAGNALAGNTTGQQPGSGADSYTVTFVVQGGAELAVQMTQGLQYTDVLSPVAGTSATAYPFYKSSDTVFAYPDQANGVSDVFSSLAAYGMVNGTYRFLIQSDTTGSVQTVPMPAGYQNLAGLPVAGSFYNNPGATTELGIFTGTAWYLFSTSVDSNNNITLNTPPTVVPWSTIGGPRGLPVVGDFNGGGQADLAVWSNGKFYVSFAATGYQEIDDEIPLNVAATNARPVAVDFDRQIINGNPISDLGLWVPTSVPSTTNTANWYFLPSGGIPLVNQTTFTPVDIQFGSSVGVPITGIFPFVSGQVTPQAAPAASPLHLAAAPKLATAVVPAAAKTAAPPAPTSITVNGTAGNDTVLLVAGKAGGWVLTVNGKNQTIASSVTTLNLNGLGGSNKLLIVGTGKSETADLWPTKASFQSGNLTVTATNFSNKTVVGGGNDVVQFHDAAGANALVASPGAAKLSGAAYTEQALNFARASVFATVGNNDTADLYAATATPVVKSFVSSEVVTLVDAGIDVETTLFKKVLIHNKAGVVTQTIAPPSAKAAAVVLKPTTLSPATSISLKTVLAAAAAVLAQNNPKPNGPPPPALVDAVLASYAS